MQENDTGPDDCNHAQFGAFILRAPHMTPRGEIDGMHLLDVAPTLWDVGAARYRSQWRDARFFVATDGQLKDAEPKRGLLTIMSKFVRLGGGSSATVQDMSSGLHVYLIGR